MSTDDGNGETQELSCDQLKRFEWLIETYERHIQRGKDAFDSLNQKATWTLATATGLAAATGFVKGSEIGNLVSLLVDQKGADLNAVGIVVLISAALFTVSYLALIHFVIRVYKPKTFEYPVSPINPELGPITSRHKDKGKFGTECWNDVLDRYVLPDEIEFWHKVLRGYIDTHIETFLTNERMGSHLVWAFRMLYLASLTSIVILFLA